jgi:hypothetical protein
MTLTNYRCFAARQEIELRPLTVVLGRNNSGKSALVRAPLIMETGIRTDSPSPLDLDMLARFGAGGDDMVGSFTDLICGLRPHGSITIGMRLGTPDGRLSLNATVQNIDEFQTQIISNVELGGDSTSAPVRLTWEQDTGEGRESRYLVEHAGVRRPGVRVGFTGLFPRQPPDDGSGMPSGAASHLLRIRDRIRGSFPTIRYMGPFRDRPQRQYRLGTRPHASVGATGENTAGVLLNDAVRRGGRLLDSVNTRLESELGWRVEVEGGGVLYSVILVSRDDPTLRVNLADTGTGIAQELPIIVQRIMDDLAPPQGPVLEVVEQPELHLHPGAHGALANLYLDAATRSPVRFLIETHSETFVLRLRRLIAEGKYDPDAVALYFVDHRDGRASTRHISVASDGTLDYWPEGVFTEDYAETRAIVDAQLARRRGAR